MNKHEVLANRYEIVKKIGYGGMADVYLAFDQLLKRDVAIKILKYELSNDAVSLLRFKHEAVAVSKLSHPNIVDIYDIGEHNLRQYIVMEYVDGKTLKELIVERGGLYKEEAVYIMKQLASAIAEAHKNDIIHRDIKPQNILVKSDGSVIVTDFGIALAENALHLTQNEMVVGSVHYLAPELARGEKAVFQSDIYALGVVFYELLVGKLPYSGESAIQVAMQHINNPFPSVREHNANIPQSIENIITKATYKNKLYRYQNINEMLLDLETCLDESRLNEKKIHQDINVMEEDKTKVIAQIDDVPVKKKQNRLKYLSITGLFLAITLIMFILSRQPANKKEEISVPSIVGLTLDQAIDKLNDVGLIVGQIERDLSEDLDINYVMKQSPRENSQVEKGSEIDLLVSNGKYFIFDDYTGENIDIVKARLESSLKIAINVEHITDSSKKAGEIISQSITKRTKINPNNAFDVKFVVVTPLEIVIPNNIYGMEINEAAKILEDMGVVVRFEAITNKSIEFLKAQIKNRVEYTNPSKNSRYVQSDNSYVTIYYYEEIEEDDIVDEDQEQEEQD